MNTKHTPGPWHAVRHNSGTFEILGDDTYPILSIRGGMTPVDANARLIAAAPDLVEALKACRKHLNKIDEQGCPADNMAEAALKKAGV